MSKKVITLTKNTFDYNLKPSLYFSYGSNLNITQMKHRCPLAKPIKTVILPNYRLQFCGNSSGNGVATIEPCGGSFVPGALWDITSTCLVALDRYEGYPRLYDRTEVLVVDRSGQEYSAMTYYMVNDPPLSLPSRYYFDVILDGYSDFNLPEEHLYKTLKEQRDIMKKAEAR